MCLQTKPEFNLLDMGEKYKNLLTLRHGQSHLYVAGGQVD
jgi:hypothetical protein